MLKKVFIKLVARYGLLWLIQCLLAAGVVILLVNVILMLVLPVHFEGHDSNMSVSNDIISGSGLYKPAEPNNGNFSVLAEAVRSGLFRASTGLRDKPMADNTIERIKSQLKVRCIMEMNNRPVAYINIKGIGLKRCMQGERINDLFTVLSINKRSVEITIVKHKVILHL